MLDRVGESEEIAPGVFQTVTQGDQFLPTVDGDKPFVFEIADEFFRFDAEVDNVAVRPNKWVERFHVGDCRPVLLPTMDLHGAGLAQFYGDNSRGWVGPKQNLVLFEFHESNRRLRGFNGFERRLQLLMPTGAN